MKIKVLPALVANKPAIEQMMELYQYDLSEFEDTDLDEDGYFGYEYLDYYWTEPNRYPFIVRFENKLAGFVLVNEYTHFSDSQHSVAEFFILRKYRRRGIGRQVAFDIFEQFSGRWEISHINTNTAAESFWRSSVGDYTRGDYTETNVEKQGRSVIVQRFDDHTHFKKI